MCAPIHLYDTSIISPAASDYHFLQGLCCPFSRRHKFKESFFTLIHPWSIHPKGVVGFWVNLSGEWPRRLNSKNMRLSQTGEGPI